MIPIKFVLIILTASVFFTFSPQVESVLVVESNVSNTDEVKKVSTEPKTQISQKDTPDKDVSKQKQSKQGQDKVTWRDNPNGCDMSEQYVAKSDFSCINKPKVNQGSTPQTAPQPPQAPPNGLNERERITYDFYTSRGFTHTATAYLMGTIKQESVFDHTVYGDNGRALGLFQWHPDRRVGMPMTFQGQLQWSVQELQNSYPEILSTLKTSNNRSQVMGAIQGWIRYGHAGRRYEYARQYLSSF